MLLHVQRHNRIFLWLNLLFLLFVASTPFFAGLIMHHLDDRLALAAYASNLVGAGLALEAIWWYSSTNRRLVDPAIDPTWWPSSTAESLSRQRSTWVQSPSHRESGGRVGDHRRRTADLHLPEPAGPLSPPAARYDSRPGRRPEGGELERSSHTLAGRRTLSMPRGDNGWLWPSSRARSAGEESVRRSCIYTPKALRARAS